MRLRAGAGGPAPARANGAPGRGEDSWDPLLLAVAGLLLCYIWRVQSLFGILATFQLPALSLLGACGLFLVDRDPRRTIRILKHPVGLLVLALLAAMTLSIPFGIYQGNSFRFVVQTHTKTVIAFGLVAVSVRSFEDLERLMKVWVAGALVYSLDALMAYQSGAYIWLTAYDNNDFALLTAITLPLCIYFGKEARTMWWRVVCLGSLVLFSVMLVLSSSRTGFLAAVACVGYLLVGYRALPARYRLGTVMVMAAGFIWVAGEEYQEELSTMFQPTEDYNWAGESPTGRMEIWERGLGYWWKYPVLGIGPKNFNHAEGRLSEKGEERQSIQKGWKWSSPHNSYLEILTETGLVGITIFLGLLWAAFKGLRALTRGPPPDPGLARRLESMAHALTASLLAYASGAFFLTHGYSEFLYILLGLTVALLKTSVWRGWLPEVEEPGPATPRGSPAPASARGRRPVPAPAAGRSFRR